MRRAPWWILLLAIAVRALVAVRTEVPGRDGVSYLWMAQQFAAGSPRGLFETVFHPLYAALVGVVVWALPALDVVRAGQLVASGLGALAVLPLWRATVLAFGERAALAATLAYATGAWFARHPAECMSEGPFYLCVCIWAQALLATPARPLRAGLAAGLAFAARPEGAALWCVAAVLAVRRRDRRGLVLVSAGAAPFAALVSLGFWWAGQGLTLTPKAAFNYEVGVGAAAAPLWHYVHEAAALPGAAAEELGWLWFPLVLVGMYRRRPRALLAPAVVLLAPFVLQCAVVPLLHSHWRFLSGFGVLVLPFAGAAVADAWPALARRHRALPFAFVALLAAAEGRMLQARNREGAIERELGRALASRLEPGEFVVSDMPRLDWFAGQKPPPPRPITADHVLARAAEPGCRFVALVDGRTPVAEAALRKLGLEPMLLPPLACPPAGRRVVLLFARTRSR